MVDSSNCFTSKDIAIPDNIALCQEQAWEPLAYSILFEHIKICRKLGEYVPLSALNNLLRDMLGYSRPKAKAAIDFMIKRNMFEEKDGAIDFGNYYEHGYVKLSCGTLNYFLTRYPKDTMAIKLYNRLLHWHTLSRVGGWSGPYKFCIGGSNKNSLLHQIGYNSTSARNRDKAANILKQLIEDGLITCSNPQKETNFGRVIGSYRTLISVNQYGNDEFEGDMKWQLVPSQPHDR